MLEIIKQMPEDFKGEALEVVAKLLEAGQSDPELIEQTLKYRLQEALKQKKLQQKGSHTESLPEETNKEYQEKSRGEDKTLKVMTATKKLQELIQTQEKSNFVYHYTTFVQMSLPTSRRYEQVIDTSTEKPIHLYKIKSEHKREHLRFSRSTGNEIIVWSTTMPEPKHFSGNKEDKFGNFLSEIGTGLPFGCAARMLITYAFTKAKRTKSREIDLGKSIREPMREMGITPKSGKGRNVYQWTEQLYKLRYAAFSHTTKLTNENDKSSIVSDVAHVYPLFESSTFWWDENYDGSAKLVIDERVFADLMDHSMPSDLRILTKIYSTKSALAMDLWLWSQYRLNDMVKSNNSLIRMNRAGIFNQFSNEININHFEEDLISAIGVIDKIVGDYNPLKFNKEKKMLYITKKLPTALNHDDKFTSLSESEFDAADRATQ